MNSHTHFESDPELDQLLVHWRQQLDCDETQLQRMQDAVTSLRIVLAADRSIREGEVVRL